MDDLTLVRRHGEEFGPAHLEPPTAVTEHVLTAFRSASGRPLGSPRWRVAGRTVSTRWSGGRSLLWLAPLGAVATTVALVATGALSLGGGSTTGPGTTSRSGGPAQGEVNLDARSILLAAAAQARTESMTVPEPGHYVYSRFTLLTEGPGTADGPVTTDSETWLAVDGGRRGLEVVAMTQEGKALGPPLSVPRPACAQERPAQGQEQYCGGSGYVTDIPQDPAAATALLRRPGRSLGWTSNPFCQNQPDCATTDDVTVFTGAATALSQRLMPPASRAAIFEGLSGLSTATVLPQATAGGRSGVGLVVQGPGLPDRADSSDTITVLLVFDRTSHELVGFRLDLHSAASAAPVAIEAATGSLQVVRDLGQRPDGTRIDPALLSP